MTYPSNSESIAHDLIVSYVRRIESIEDEKKALNDDLSEIYKEARGNGFDVKVLRKVIADRRKDANERAEFETIYELYWNAIHGLAHAHVENIGEFGSDAFGVARVMRYGAEQGEVLNTSSTAALKASASLPIIAERAGAGSEIDGATQMPSEPAGTQAPPVDTVQEPPVLYPADPSRSEAATRKDADPAAPETNTREGVPADEAEPTQVEASSVPRKRQWKHSDPPHRDCLDPGQCGGFSNLGLCQRCKDAAA